MPTKKPKVSRFLRNARIRKQARRPVGIAAELKRLESLVLVRQADKDFLYGAKQALHWALGHNAMAPSRMVHRAAEEKRNG